MDTKKDIHPLDQFSNITFAKDAVVGAWIEANKLTPQSFLGINILVLAAFLEDPHLDLNQNLDHSTFLSPDQLQHVKNSMNGFHKAHAIASHTREYADKLIQLGGEVPKIVNDGRILSVWRAGGNRILGRFLAMIKLNNYSEEAVSELKSSVLKLREILNSSEFKEIAEGYKKRLSSKDSRAGRLFITQATELVEKEFFNRSPQFSNISSEDIYRLMDLVGFHVRKFP